MPTPRAGGFLAIVPPDRYNARMHPQSTFSSAALHRLAFRLLLAAAPLAAALMAAAAPLPRSTPEAQGVSSTGIQAFIGEGKLNLDDAVLQFFPEDAPAEPGANLRAMRVRDLLTMSTGHDSEVKFTAETPWVRLFLAHPVPRPPGSHFMHARSLILGLYSQ